MAGRTQKREEDDGTIAPLYARLPRGPHQLARGEVADNQRQRMHGAMVEAVAANGYGRTSVRQVVSLAGVSRRAFYEQFTNKQDCFLATIDLVAARAAVRIREAYRSAGPDLDARMAAALGAYAELVRSNPKSAHLVMIDAPSAGAPGWARLTKMLLNFENMLSASFSGTPGAIPLPVGVVRGIAGALHRIAYTRVRDERTAEIGRLVEEMLCWTLSMQAPAVERLGPRAGLTRNTAGGVDRSLASAQPETLDRQATPPATAPERPRHGDDRIRILESALEMATVEGYENLSPLRIVDHAGVSIDTFFNLFGDLETCFMEALSRLAQTVNASVGDPGLDEAPEKWAVAAARSVNSLTRHFARHPTHAHMVARGAFEMGAGAIDLDTALADEVARRLLQAAPAGYPSIARDAVAGAIWHTIYCHAVSRQTHRLPAVAGQLAYVVLAPVVGAEEAVAAVTAVSAPPRRSSSHGERVTKRTDAVTTVPL